MKKYLVLLYSLALFISASAGKIEVGPANCVDSIYSIDIVVGFADDAEALVLEGADIPGGTIKVSLLISPYTYSVDNLSDAGSGNTHQVKASVYKDDACTKLLSEETLEFVAPDFICTKTHLLEACLGSKITLSSTFEGDVYDWSTGDNTRSVKVTDSVAHVSNYSVRTYRATMELKNNLMANGGFETNPPSGFSSDYNYAGWEMSDYYSSHAEANNLYTITSNANTFWHDYAVVKPHSGNYFALFDAGKSGYAWTASTADNPALKIDKDTTYVFSYWAAYPNKSAGNNAAILQFEIKYVDSEGVEHKERLGTPYVLGEDADLNGWHQQVVSWKAPMSSDNVTIGVYDKNSAGQGNDFALDDIMFQSTHAAELLLAFEDVYVVTYKDCSPKPDPDPEPDPEPDPDPDPEPDPEPEPTPDPCTGGIVWAKWNDVLFVDNSDSVYVAYQWYKDSVAVAGATGQYYRDTIPPQGAYYVVITLSDGQKIHTCEVRFSDAPRSADCPENKLPIAEQQLYYVTDRFRIVRIVYADESIQVIKEIVLP